MVEAVKWLSKAAVQGHAEAKNKLALCRENGDGVAKNKAEAVNDVAQGNTVEKDLVEAVHKAAKQGEAVAQYNLGVCYEFGKGVEKNLVEAVKWYRKAARQGEAKAQYSLGVCYEFGNGVEKSYVEAVKWYRKAAKQGKAYAQTAINRLENSEGSRDDKNCNNYLAVTTGSLPYNEEDFDEFLLTKVKDIFNPSKDIGIIIVGREFNQTILDEQINLRRGQSLFVYSQEMFLSLLAGKDPYDDEDALMEFAQGHPVFEYLNDCFIEWPTTHIVPSSNVLDVDDEEWPDEGVLKNNGYKVGRTGKRREERRRILTKVLTTKLNNVDSLKYMNQWGTPSSGNRLKKMADSVASFARSAQRMNNPPQQAIADWVEDLDWLKKTYYNGRFNFDWPRAAVR